MKRERYFQSDDWYISVRCIVCGNRHLFAFNQANAEAFVKSPWPVTCPVCKRRKRITTEEKTPSLFE